MRLAVLIAALLFTLPVCAQDISVKMDQIAEGSVLSFSTGQDISTSIFKGRVGDHYRIDVVTGDDLQDPLQTTQTIRDAQGQGLQRTLPDGTLIRYVPHDCRRTLGDCHYKELREGKSFQIIRTTTATENGFSSEQVFVDAHGTARPMTSSSMIFDAYGMLETGTWTNHFSGQSQDLKRLSTDYK